MLFIFVSIWYSKLNELAAEDRAVNFKRLRRGGFSLQMHCKLTISREEEFLNVFRYRDNFREEKRLHFAICSILQLEWNEHDAVWNRWLSNFETNWSLSSYENYCSFNADISCPNINYRNEYTDSYKHSWPIRNSRKYSRQNEPSLGKSKYLELQIDHSDFVTICVSIIIQNRRERERERERESWNTVRRDPEHRSPNQRSKLPRDQKIELTVTIDSDAQRDFFN